ncbi:MAG TPA: ABC transporter permease [Trebonia sp.]|nr:ABC transporter permease [Trebonia sp.]
MYRSPFIPAVRTSGITVTAADPALPAALDATLAHGRFLNAATARYPAVVLGAEAASLLGIRNLAQPAQVWLGGHWFTVVGILNPLRPPRSSPGRRPAPCRPNCSPPAPTTPCSSQAAPSPASTPPPAPPASHPPKHYAPHDHT